MKWWAVMFFSVFLTVMCCLRAGAENEDDFTEVSARSAILLCRNNGRVIFEKNPDEKLGMASTTKIMTTLIALEQAKAEDKEVTFSKEMIAEGSSMYLKEGYRLRLSDLAAGMMSVSGNDAANAAAFAVSGSKESFGKLMNSKAEQIGMRNTHFVTPSGLDDDEHYSTARDMAKLMDYAMSNEAFAELTAKKNVRVDFMKPENMSVTYGNHNKLLSLYEYCNGGKTGFTTKSGRCLVSSAEKEGVKLIAVTLNAPDDWNDHIKMYEYGFSRLSAVSNADDGYCLNIDVVGGKADFVRLIPVRGVNYVKSPDSKGRLTRRVIIDKFLYAPLEKGQAVGTAQYFLDGEKICEIPLVTASAVEALEKKKGIMQNIFDFFAGIFR